MFRLFYSTSLSSHEVMRLLSSPLLHLFFFFTRLLSFGLATSIHEIILDLEEYQVLTLPKNSHGFGRLSVRRATSTRYAGSLVFTSCCNSSEEFLSSSPPRKQGSGGFLYETDTPRLHEPRAMIHLPDRSPFHRTLTLDPTGSIGPPSTTDT